MTPTGSEPLLATHKGVWANIPPKRNRNSPICFSPNRYRARNLIERFFNKIKQCRRVATRFRQARGQLPRVRPACSRLESAEGELGGRQDTGEKIRRAIETAGVEFIDENGGGQGVRLRKRQKQK
jgi:hypothetical protein